MILKYKFDDTYCLDLKESNFMDRGPVPMHCIYSDTCLNNKRDIVGKYCSGITEGEEISLKETYKGKKKEMKNG